MTCVSKYDILVTTNCYLSKLLEFNSAGRFAGEIVQTPVDTPDLVDNLVGDPLQPADWEFKDL
jgi:hypothetical protein